MNVNPVRYSIIVPVFNRPQELDELLESLTHQTFKGFEVIIVEDGSSDRSDRIVEKYSGKLRIQYFYKPNTGPGPSRNFGYGHAKGEYFVVFDSDCIIPSQYLEVVERSIQEHSWDAWGGPDQARDDFTLLQRAMGYTMASFLTTGGIRGGKKHVGWFQPRSFNMGISRRVFASTGGFKFDRFAEDIEFSIRMRNASFKVGLIPDAFVYHKRRTTFRQFYNQVYNFGRGRALVGKAHPGEIKLTHWFPTFFVMGVCSLIILPLLSIPLFFSWSGWRDLLHGRDFSAFVSGQPRFARGSFVGAQCVVAVVGIWNGVFEGIPAEVEKGQYRMSNSETPNVEGDYSPWEGSMNAISFGNLRRARQGTRNFQ